GLGLLLALGTAVAFNWAWVAQHSAASQLPPLSVRRPLQSLRLLFSHRGWVVGFSTGVVGWGFYVLALALAPLSLVQAVSAGGVGTKAATFGGWWLAFVPALLACHGLAFVVIQLGFQRGRALATAGLSSLLTNALPIAAGVAVFHESLPGGVLGALRLVAFACVVAGAAVLARPERAAEPAPVAA